MLPFSGKRAIFGWKLVRAHLGKIGAQISFQFENEQFFC
jgi:hypothetical protein